MNELKAIGLRLQEATVRIEQVIFLPGMVCLGVLLGYLLAWLA